MQRAAEEGDVAADGTAACEAGDGLHDDGLEDGGGNVFLLRSLVEQRLNIGLGKDAAARGDRVDDGVVAGELVQAGCVRVEQGRHLVDERAGAARAGAVHALLDAAVEVDDLRVLAAELDGNVGARDDALDGGLVSDDLLDERHAEPVGEQQTARAGDGDGRRTVADLLERLVDDADDGRADVGVVAAVDGVDNSIGLVEDEQLYGGGADVDADAQRFVLRVHDFSSLSISMERRYSLIDSPGLMNSRRIAMRAICSELSFMPVSIQRLMTPM